MLDDWHALGLHQLSQQRRDVGIRRAVVSRTRRAEAATAWRTKTTTANRRAALSAPTLSDVERRQTTSVQGIELCAVLCKRTDDPEIARTRGIMQQG
jgi:hypothetical protein